MFRMLSALLFLFAADAMAQAKFIKVPVGYLMVLRKGDQVFTELERLAYSERIPSASLQGMGFVRAEFGYWNPVSKKYDPKAVEGELASMTGTIAWKAGQPSIHAHGLVTGKDFAAFGGHLLRAEVGIGSVEILITLHDKKLERFEDSAIGGANILSVDGSKK